MPFFQESSILELTQKKVESLVPKCGVCRLYKSCQSPKMKPYGKGRKGILILGEAPGKEEDKRGKPFVGPFGRFLKDHLEMVGIDMDRDC